MKIMSQVKRFDWMLKKQRYKKKTVESAVSYKTKKSEVQKVLLDLYVKSG